MAEVESSRLVSRPPLVDFTREDAQPPAPVYIGLDDKLYLRSVSLVSTVDARLSGRLLHADGVIRPFSFLVTIPGAISTQVFPLAEGFLLSLAIVAVTTTVPRGRAWVNVGILRGRPADLQGSQLLIADYVATDVHLGWPGGVFRSSVEGAGEVSHATVADPGAGAEWTQTVTADQRWRVLTLRFTFTTDATVANRFPRVEIVAPGAIVQWRSHVHTAQAASLAVVYNFAIGTDFISTIDQGEANNELPDEGLRGGMIIRSSTVGIVAGDDYSLVQMSREQWVQDS